MLESASLDGSLPEALAQHVDGRSTVAEIADRLGWTLRQTVLSLAAGAHTGQLRCLPADHLLVLGVQELRRKAWRRAAVRLEAWCERGTPGGLPPEVAEELASEWGSGRLVTTVRLMSERGVWTLLQRLDHGYDDAPERRPAPPSAVPIGKNAPAYFQNFVFEKVVIVDVL